MEGAEEDLRPVGGSRNELDDVRGLGGLVQLLLQKVGGSSRVDRMGLSRKLLKLGNGAGQSNGGKIAAPVLLELLNGKRVLDG